MKLYTLLFFLFSSITIVFSDTIQLEDGNKLNGKIKSQTEDIITIQKTDGSIVSIKKKRVQSIEYSFNQDESIPQNTDKNNNKEDYFDFEFNLNPVLKSAIIPTWGLFSLNRKQEGGMYSLLMTAAIINVYQSQKDVSAYSKSYNLNSGAFSNILDGSIGAVFYWNNVKSFQEYQVAVNRYNLSLYLVSILYISQLFHTYYQYETNNLERKVNNSYSNHWNFNFYQNFTFRKNSFLEISYTYHF